MAKNKNSDTSARPMTDETRAKLAVARAKPRASVHEFVAAWIENDTVVKIAAMLDVGTSSVQTRAKTLRKLGVELPVRAFGGPGRRGGRGRVGYSSETVERLNRLIAGAQNGTLTVGDNGQAQVEGEDVFDNDAIL
jgi:hypothetical protein